MSGRTWFKSLGSLLVGAFRMMTLVSSTAPFSSALFLACASAVFRPTNLFLGTLAGLAVPAAVAGWPIVVSIPSDSR